MPDTAAAKARLEEQLAELESRLVEPSPIQARAK